MSWIEVAIYLASPIERIWLEYDATNSENSMPYQMVGAN